MWRALFLLHVMCVSYFTDKRQAAMYFSSLTGVVNVIQNDTLKQ